jgi:tryptophan synthase beta chain
LACKESGEAKVILTALCGHGLLDLAAYEAYLHGELEDNVLSEEALQASLATVPTV